MRTSSGIYRQEAVEYHRGAHTESEVLLMLPGWTHWLYRLLLCLLAGGLGFVVFGSVSQYAEGPAIIRAEERVSITATVSGVVASVRVTPGMRVESGDLLVRFRSADEEAQMASVQREFDSSLVRILANPADQAARQRLGTLRAQAELMSARLGERFVRALEAGTIGDVRIKPGQSVAPGDMIASLARERARFFVLALLPGQQRPSLQQGLPMRLEIAGYPYVYQNLIIDSVDDGIIGPYEVRRGLGPEVADSIAISGPVVVVHARLPDVTFVSGGEVYRYFDGMHAVARARLRSERLLAALIPGIKVLTDRSK